MIIEASRRGYGEVMERYRPSELDFMVYRLPAAS
jgi:hypothetical protein